MDLYEAFVHAQLQKEIDQNRQTSLRTDNLAVTLEARVRSLEIANAALWALLKPKLGCTDEELAAEVDALIGPDHCPSCGRRHLTANAINCGWCGLPLDRKPGGL